VSRSWLLYLDDLIASAEKIGRLVAGKDAATRDSMPSAHRAGPARLRDLIAHHDFALDSEIIWEVATTHVPELLRDARGIRQRADATS
jgi:uncharacterized protein with HEPN domain